MALSRYFASDPWSEFYTVPTLFDQDFGLGMRLSDLVQPLIGHIHSGYLRPWRHIDGHQSGVSKIQIDDDNFKVVMDVQHFSPNEITVKTIKNQVVIEGKHEEKPDEHGFISRHFIRRYQLPQGINEDSVISTLSSDGVLTISAVRNPPLGQDNVRTIPITMSKAPAVKSVSEPSKAEEEVKPE